jgi:pSer/pThr/pTyr-binding forkhead associated (FHA) protein
MASLRLVPASGSPIEIGQDQVLVGRETTCDVVLNDGSVSRKHARLERRGRGWMVIDQGSANGTFVDSQRVAETTLRTGQELRFGAVGFRVEIEGDEAVEATMLTEAPEATVVQPVTPALPPSRPPAPPAPPAPPRAAPPPPPPPPPLSARSAPVPPTGSLPPGSIPGRVSTPPRPAPGSRPPVRASMPPTPAAEAAPPKKGKGPLFWIATGCCGCLLLGMILSALIGGFAFHMTADAVAAVRAQLADVKAGNLDGAYDRFSDEYKARVSREEFEVLVSRHPGLRENADSTFWKRSVENTRGEVSGMLTSSSGTREMVTYRLVKEGGVWKISDIEFAGQTQT